MKLVVIYGPPAVGKLTTAERLGEMTGYRVFHSHLAIDLVNSITPEDSGKLYADFLFRIIYETIEFAWKNKQQGLIMSIAYTGSDKQKDLLKKLKKLVESDGGAICFVKLFASMDELKHRVVNPSRDYYGKLMDAEELERWMSKTDYLSKVDISESLEIDNTDITPDVVAEKIKSHFRL
jgi:deoxyadenosine/deoxycytidine kinase